jgi:hypothetical protein
MSNDNKKITQEKMIKQIHDKIVKKDSTQTENPYDNRIFKINAAVLIFSVCIIFYYYFKRKNDHKESENGSKLVKNFARKVMWVLLDIFLDN